MESYTDRLEELRRRAQEFHNENPRVWELFVRFTFDRINRGYKRYSADAVMHRVRWETDAGIGGADGKAPFKINDHHVTFYARRFMRVYAEHEGFFALRKQTSRGRPAKNYDSVDDR